MCNWVKQIQKCEAEKCTRRNLPIRGRYAEDRLRTDHPKIQAAPKSFGGQLQSLKIGLILLNTFQLENIVTHVQKTQQFHFSFMNTGNVKDKHLSLHPSQDEFILFKHTSLKGFYSHYLFLIFYCVFLPSMFVSAAQLREAQVSAVSRSILRSGRSTHNTSKEGGKGK